MVVPTDSSLTCYTTTSQHAPGSPCPQRSGIGARALLHCISLRRYLAVTLTGNHGNCLFCRLFGNFNLKICSQFLVAGFSVVAFATAKKVHKHQTWVSYIGIEALIQIPELEVVFCFLSYWNFQLHHELCNSNYSLC